MTFSTLIDRQVAILWKAIKQVTGYHKKRKQRNRFWLAKSNEEIGRRSKSLLSYRTKDTEYLLCLSTLGFDKQGEFRRQLVSIQSINRRI